MAERIVTFNLDDDEVYAMLVNSLAAYAQVLDGQSEERRSASQDDYGDYLAGLAGLAREMVEQVERAAAPSV